MVALFLIDPTVIWLDFEAPGLPESREIEKKMLLEFCCFLVIKKYARDRFLWISGFILGSVLEPRAAKKVSDRVFFFGSFSGGAHSKFRLPFSLKNHVFYEGVFQNLAFCSRVGPKVPQKR